MILSFSCSFYSLMKGKYRSRSSYEGSLGKVLELDSLTTFKVFDAKNLRFGKLFEFSEKTLGLSRCSSHCELRAMNHF